MEPGFAEELWDGIRHDPDTFKWFTSVPSSWTQAGYLDFVAMLADTGLCHAIVADGHCVGSSTLFDIRTRDRGIEIGYTHYSPAVRGTKVNPLAKSLLLGQLVEGEQANRVQLKTDSRNLASQKAMEKLGLVREGTLRRVVVMPDGHLRDTVYYSLLASEWPTVQETIGRVALAKPWWPSGTEPCAR